MKVLGIAGYSGNGKTTLVVRLIPELRSRGYAVSTVKHTHHNVAVDRGDAASRALRKAGAAEVLVATDDYWALMHEHHDAPEASLAELCRHMTGVDILLVEGFKQHDHDKIEVHRRATGKPLLCLGDPNIVAIASDQPVDGVALPQLNLDDIPAIADFIVGRTRNGRRGRG